MIVQRAVNAGRALVREGANVVQGAASHVLWWVDHKAGGSARKAPADPRRPPHSGD